MEYKGQKEWGWDVALYLFFADAAAGSYAIGILLSLFNPEKYPLIEKISTAIALPLLLIGTFFLITHLGVKSRAAKSLANVSSSWISRGVVITTIFMLFCIIGFIRWLLPDTTIERFLLENYVTIKYIEGIGLIFAFLRMIYASSLLSVIRPIAMWSNPILIVLFIITSLVCGFAFISLTGNLLYEQSFIEKPPFIFWKIIGLVVLSLVFLFYLTGTHRTKESRAGVHNIIEGHLSDLYYFGVMIAGILLPLMLTLFIETIHAREFETKQLLQILCAISILIGGLILRYIVLASGVKAPLRVGNLEYPIPFSGKPQN